MPIFTNKEENLLVQQSNEIGEIAKALSKAQSECHAATKDKNNPFFKSRYATLEEIIAVLKKPLADNGLSITQFTDFEENSTWLETQISHSSGQWMRGRYLLNPTDNKPQTTGSAITYAKRYALQAAMLVPSEDDDGNAAQAAPQKQEPKPAKKEKASVNDIESIRANIHSTVLAKKIPGEKIKALIAFRFAPKTKLAELDIKECATLLSEIQNA
jgi:hypothetical protein